MKQRRSVVQATAAAAAAVLLMAILLISMVQCAGAFQSQLVQQQWHTLRPTLSRHSYANTADPPPRPEAGNSFEQRMREILRKQQAQQKRQRQQQSKKKQQDPFRSSNRPSFLKHVTTLQDYKTVVGDAETISVVRFYSPFCRSCKAATPAFDALARRHPNLNWVEVPVTQENASLHQGLGVPSVPFGHIYIPGSGLAEERRMIRPLLGCFARVLESYVEGECELPELDAESGIYENPYNTRR